MLQFSFFY